MVFQSARQLISLRRYTNQVLSASNTRTSPTFNSLDIHPSLKSSIKNEFKFENMTTCQAQTIAPLLCNQDVHLLSKTGSGKTLAFLIPSISTLLLSGARLGNNVSILVISPTRELAMQV
jgi:ATP-dependent RNA helicase MSS116